MANLFSCGAARLKRGSVVATICTVVCVADGGAAKKVLCSRWVTLSLYPPRREHNFFVQRHCRLTGASATSSELILYCTVFLKT